MTAEVDPAPSPAATTAPPRWLVVLLAISCGLTVANLYYAQPLLPMVRDELGIGTVATGWLITVIQLGYAAGMVLLVPLGDRLERRRLVAVLLALATAALVVVGTAETYPVLLGAALLAGATCTVAQILVPFAADLSPDAVRGRVVGQVVSGLLAGVLLSRVVASAAAGLVGWRGVYLGSAVVMAALAVALRLALPARRPTTTLSYGRLLGSTVQLIGRHPVLRRRALYQATMFSAFSAFWTTVSYLLTSPPFSYSSTGVALFALVGAGGALIAPAAGRWADRGLARPLSAACFAAAALAFGLMGPGRHSILLLALGAVLLDMAVQANFILGQHAIYQLDATARSRLNSVYLATFFTGGAIGAQLGSVAYHLGGWSAVVVTGGALPLVALVDWLTRFNRR